jgi:L-ornithine Nalpha-acyltransferase
MTTIHTTDVPLVRTGTLEVKLASTFAEIDRAMRLRFEVFNLELQEGLRASYDKGYDSDPYDAYCDHLIVKDLESDNVVGTYRLLRKSRAEKQIGFYSENEFDLSNLKKLPGDLLELGRSCIAATHRNYATINLLWSAIGQYALKKNISHMFGCASLHCSDVEEVQPIYSYLRARHYAPEKYRVQPLPSCRMEIKDEADVQFDEREVLRKIPAIMKGYIRTGAIVCGPPAYDVEFGTADVFVLLEMEKMAGRYRQHYVAEAQGLR